MDLSAIYSKTPKGLRARASLIGGLSSHLMKVLTHVDGGSRAENILLKFDKLTAQQLSADLAKLEQEGYIRLATVTSAADDSWALTVNFEPMVVEEYKSEEALEASAQIQKAQQQAKQDQAEKLAAEQQAQQEEAKRLAIQEKAEKKAQKLRDKEKIKAEAKVKARLEEESREQEREQQAAAEAAETARIIAQAKIEQEAKLKAQQVAEQLEQQQAAERAAKLADETRLKAALKAREAAEQAEAQAEAMAKEHARREIERISRESEEAQKKQEFEVKAQHEAEHLEILRLAEAEARKEELLQQQLEAEALENKRMQAEKVALEQQQAQEKLAQEKLANEAMQKEKLAKEQAHLEIANVLRKAEEDRKKAAAQLKAEKLEAKRQAKAEQEERLLAERKVKEEAKELAKEQAKQQKLKAQAEEKATIDAAENESRQQEKIAKQAEHAAKQEIEALNFSTEADRKKNQTAQIVQAKLVAEEQANLAAKENARLEMERIGQEAELARQKASTQQHLDENKKSLPDRGLPDKDLPKLDDFDATEAAEEAAFAAEEEAAEAEQKIQRTIQKTAEKTAKQSAENLGRADIRNAAIAEAEALAMVHGKASSFVSAKKIKQWLGSISKITFIYVPLLALVLLALLHFINLSTLIKPIEQLATESVGEPVEIKKVHASLWPQPHLVLEDVGIGANSIKAIHLQLQATSLFEQTKVLKSLVIDGLNIEQANFGQPLNWASNISRAKNLKVEQIYLKNLTLAIRDLHLESFDGKVTLTDTGALNAIDLVSSNNALSVNIFPQGSDYIIALQAANWVLPLNQKIMFNSLSAKGMANNKQITFSQIEGDIYGGNLTAKADIKWPDGANKWEVSGDFKLTNANAEQLLNTFGSGVVISGKLSVDGNFSNKAREANRLTEATNMNASFDVHRGSIQGIELARAVMSRGSQSLAGDSTNFDKLTGNLKFNQGQTQFTKLVLASPQFNANGFINLNANQVVTGRISANLAAQSRRLQANFAITGRDKDLKSN